MRLVHLRASRPSSVAATKRVKIVAKVNARPIPDMPDEIGDDKRGPKIGSREWFAGFVSKFTAPQQRAKLPTVLDFERPIVELEAKIQELRKASALHGIDVKISLDELEGRLNELRKETYGRLTPTQRLAVARHPNRPTFLDIALNITDKFVELHGDRAGLDDPAVVCGLGTIAGTTFMLIGHQKGRNTKENVYRNFGMPQPNGYRKAMRFMRYANKFGMPIITFVDTPGAYAGKAAEELGQGEAIAYNLREMFSLRVPILSLVIGEGGSGGALAIGCANRMLMMENAVYYVASPEACAAILWKSREKAPVATRALRITAKELNAMRIVDEIVPEPLGGSHLDPENTFPRIKLAILRNYARYVDMTDEEVMAERYVKFRTIGLYEDYMIKGGQAKKAKEDRAKAQPFYTAAGTKCTSKEEVEYIETAVDREEQWEVTLKDKSEFLWKPDMPPVVEQAGVIELAQAAIKLRRAKQNRSGVSSGQTAHV